MQISFSAFNKDWTYNNEKQSCIEVETYPSDWLLSPDGKKAVLIRNHNLWLRDLGNGEERQLTQDGERFYSYAKAPSAYGIVIKAGTVEARWSPDSRRVFTLQLDTREVRRFPIIEHIPQDGSLRPVVTDPERRVALPGDSYVDEYRFLAIDVETGRHQDAHFKRCSVFRNAVGFFTYGNGWWGEDSRHTYFIDIERGGDHVARMVEFDTFTGATRVVIEEESPDTCFKINLNSHEPTLTRPLPDSRDLIWYSERSGWGHLYLYDLDTGKLKHPITEGEWLVLDVLHYDSKRRELLIQTADRVKGRNAYYRDICRVNVDTGKLTPILSTDHEYVVFDPMSEMAANLTISKDIFGAGGVSPNGDYIVTTRSRSDDIPVSILVDREGNELLKLETADVSGLPYNWQWPETVKLKAADGKTDIYGVVHRPSDFSPTKSYPVIDVSQNFGEGRHFPAGSFTNNSMAGYRYLVHSAYAELGFIVVTIFGRGTSSRYRSFSASPNPELPSSDNQHDRIAGIRQLAERYPYIDIARVGAGGGFMTNPVAVSGLLGHPDFYKVGVSDCALVDMRTYPAFAGEGYAGLPATEDTRKPMHELAANLKGKLLLMHGMLDPVVPVAQTFRLVDALQAANKDFDMLILPKDGHALCSYATRRAWDYFVKYLLGIEPPEEFKLTSSLDILIRGFIAKQAKATAD